MNASARSREPCPAELTPAWTGGTMAAPDMARLSAAWQQMGRGRRRTQRIGDGRQVCRDGTDAARRRQSA
jgi:hypothetical protein